MEWELTLMLAWVFMAICAMMTALILPFRRIRWAWWCSAILVLTLLPLPVAWWIYGR